MKEGGRISHRRVPIPHTPISWGLCRLHLEKQMAVHSRTLAWKIPWLEEPGGLQSTGSQRSDMTEGLHFFFSFFRLHRGRPPVGSQTLLWTRGGHTHGMEGLLLDILGPNTLCPPVFTLEAIAECPAPV